ncbi:uncharacterized protein [Primulina huaijiensis]|uniref:uncharacterized protein isoform X4 n=1 Tax=Primulina huaijiensis TaxID=1492673 RepID=UPI003CC70710
MEAAGFRALSAITSSSTFRPHPLLHSLFSSARKFPSSISSSRFSQLSFSSTRFQVKALHDGVGRVAVESVENKFLQVVLVSPQPLGFQVDDAKLKRAGLDYWPFVVVKVHSSWSEFYEYFKQEDGEKRLLAFTKRGTYIHTDFSYRKGDWLVFGSETSGLPPEALLDCKSESLGGGTIRIPMVETYVRCLNLSVSVGIALYEASRQLNYEHMQNSSEPCIDSKEIPFLTEDIFA